MTTNRPHLAKLTREELNAYAQTQWQLDITGEKSKGDCIKLISAKWHELDQAERDAKKAEKVAAKAAKKEEPTDAMQEEALNPTVVPEPPAKNEVDEPVPVTLRPNRKW